MKIALICSGLPMPPKKHKRQNELLNNMQQIFSDADMYFHTWEHMKKNVPSQYHDRLLTCPEPEITYHPFIDTPRDPNTSKKHNVARDHADREFKRRTGKAAMKKRHGHLQILGYADAYSKIEKKYDLYIRTRWDLNLHKDAKFRDFFQKAIDIGPVGFGPMETGKDPKPQLEEQPRELNISRSDRWHCYLADQMIFHSQKNFDPHYVWKLHEEKRLHPIEYGWWQVMSHPYGGDIHTCVWHGVKLVR